MDRKDCFGSIKEVTLTVSQTITHSRPECRNCGEIRDCLRISKQIEEEKKEREGHPTPRIRGDLYLPSLDKDHSPPVKSHSRSSFRKYPLRGRACSAKDRHRKPSKGSGSRENRRRDQNARPQKLAVLLPDLSRNRKVS